jgi:hypothetical protein
LIGRELESSGLNGYAHHSIGEMVNDASWLLILDFQTLSNNAVPLKITERALGNIGSFENGWGLI